MPDNKYKPFDVATVALENSNLIEASAGTGKTYSIGILTIRLIIEKEVPLPEILMVTFTNAAIAELELRIREFVKKANKVAKGEEINDALISEIVKKAIEEKDREKVINLLENAIHALDEVRIMTIHSFCQKTLNEFSIETKQLFQPELVPEIDSLMEPLVQDFWRKHITSLPVKLLEEIRKGLFENISNCVKNHISGKEFYFFEEDIKYELGNVIEETGIQLLNHRIERNQVIEELEELLNVNSSKLHDDCQENKLAVKYNAHKLIGDPYGIIQHWKKGTQYISAIFGSYGLDEKFNKITELDNNIEKNSKIIKNQILCFAIQEIQGVFRSQSQLQNVLTYDNLIQNLHAALVTNNNEGLEQNLRNKYKAVFIDEFQDTDRLQYEIFQKAFHKDTILFYIGDPKQSIYGWRGADINTYLQAVKDVQNRYSMNINFRSNESYIAALNQFFLPEENFDTFYFENKEDKILYHHVQSPEPNNAGKMLKEGTAAEGIYIVDGFKNKDDQYDALVSQISELLTNDHYIIHKEKPRKVRPSDIAVLVRENKEASAVKKRLNKNRIPTIISKDEKIFNSDEAKEILYLLEAFLNTQPSNIAKALATSIGQFSDEEILTLNLDTISSAFQNYRTIWETKGIYAALIQFVLEFNIKTRLIDKQEANRDRILTNIYHLIELLHKAQHRNNFSTTELTLWLRRNLEKKSHADEFNQRLESEEEAVRIITIHKSKGLQYNIILVPDMDWDTKPPTFRSESFRDSINGKLKSGMAADFKEEDLKVWEEQTEQGNRRLAYVALTRGVYACYLYKKSSKANTCFQAFYTKINDDSKNIFRINKVGINSKYNPEKKLPIKKETQKVHFTLYNNDWKQLNYSRLSVVGNSSKKLAFVHSGNEYDHFIFKELSHGNITGNFLHLIFENLAFNEPARWDSTVKQALVRISETKQKTYTSGLKQLIEHIMYAQIKTPSGDFTLSEIDNSKKLHELAFDFPVHEFKSTMLNSADLFEEKLRSYFYEASAGIMNGKIDLVFEWNGKYFILDWKSNYLGYSSDDYNEDGLKSAMDEGNYHLQYYIYTLALKKYLAFRLPDFDYDTHFGGVIYCFIRGMRQNESSGIYFNRPTKEQIEKLEEIVCAEIVNS